MTNCPRCQTILHINIYHARCIKCPTVRGNYWCEWKVNNKQDIIPERYFLETKLFAIYFCWNEGEVPTYNIFDSKYRILLSGVELAPDLYLLKDEQINDIVNSLIIFS
jgi:hypothetical protein